MNPTATISGLCFRRREKKAIKAAKQALESQSLFNQVYVSDILSFMISLAKKAGEMSQSLFNQVYVSDIAGISADEAKKELLEVAIPF